MKLKLTGLLLTLLIPLGFLFTGYGGASLEGIS